MLNNQNKLINLNKELEERNMQLDILGKEINQINDRLENTLNELDNAKNKIYILEKRKIKNILRNMKKELVNNYFISKEGVLKICIFLQVLLQTICQKLEY
ncbi:hypothetical protein ACK2F5_05820 [Clostridioides difficile]